MVKRFFLEKCQKIMQLPLNGVFDIVKKTLNEV